MKIYINIVFFLTVWLNCAMLKAQNTPDNADFVNAYNFIIKGSVDSAKIYIDKAIKDTAVRKNAIG